MSGDSGPSREVRVSRVFQVPREVVFQAWIDPDQVAAWWAPERCEVPRETVQIDARAGGQIRFSMVETGGAVYPVQFEIAQISPPELLVLVSEPEPEIGLPNRMLTRVVFEIHGDGTRVTITQGPHTYEMGGPAEVGWRESLDKLGARLQTGQS
jgi:uncharacterized protein YndB with AHSA1/START domain